MKTLKKEEMLKKDQVGVDKAFSYISGVESTTLQSWHTYVQNVMFWPNLTRHGLCNYTTHSKIHHTYT